MRQDIKYPHSGIAAFLATILVGLPLAGCGADSDTGAKKHHSAAATACTATKLPDATPISSLQKAGRGEKIETELPQTKETASLAVQSAEAFPKIDLNKTTLRSAAGQFVVVKLRIENEGDHSVLPASVFVNRLVLETGGSSWGPPSRCAGIVAAVGRDLKRDLPNVPIKKGESVDTFWVFAVPKAKALHLIVRYSGRYLPLSA